MITIHPGIAQHQIIIMTTSSSWCNDNDVIMCSSHFCDYSLVLGVNRVRGIEVRVKQCREPRVIDVHVEVVCMGRLEQ